MPRPLPDDPANMTIDELSQAIDAAAFEALLREYEVE